MPESIVIAGANNAGKTAFDRQFLTLLYPDVSWRLGESSTGGSTRPNDGRRVRIETTLSSKMYAKLMYVRRTLACASAFISRAALRRLRGSPRVAAPGDMSFPRPT